LRNSHALHPTWKADIDAILERDLPWGVLSGLSVLVTGAGGFLGGYLVRSLLALHTAGLVEEPVHVVAMVRDVTRARERMMDIADDECLEWLLWDMNQIAVPEIPECHYVLHAASQASPRFYGSDPIGTIMPNTIGTAGLLQALTNCADPRGLLFVSSSEVYGSGGGDPLLVENSFGTLDPATVRACYAESKRVGETMCIAWQAQHGLPTFLVRPFHTYGPGLQPNDGRVFADFCFNVVRGENIVINSDGTARRAFCYASDAVAGIFTVLLKGEPATPYNVANPAGELSVMELADLLVGLYPDRGLSVDKKISRDVEGGYIASTVSRSIPDVERLRQLGWDAQVSPSEGFRRMIEVYI
jgi:UDP-glucuronate decarboxylase